MKRWLSVAVITFLCLALVIGIACGGEEQEQGIKEVKLGWGEALSGVLGAVVGIPGKTRR